MLSIIISLVYVAIALYIFWKVSDYMYKDEEVCQVIDDEGAWVHLFAFGLTFITAAFWPLALVWANFKKDKNV